MSGSPEVILVTPAQAARNVNSLHESVNLKNMFNKPIYRSHIFFMMRGKDIIGVRKIARRRDGDIFSSTAKEIGIYKELISNKGYEDYIVKYLKSGMNGNTVYIDLEYVKGQDLTDYINDKPSLENIYTVLGQVADALLFCLNAGCAHGDIKSDNIRIAEGPKALLFDFGSGSRRAALAEKRDDLAAYIKMCEDILGTENVPIIEEDPEEAYEAYAKSWAAMAANERRQTTGSLKRSRVGGRAASVGASKRIAGSLRRAASLGSRSNKKANVTRRNKSKK